MTLNAILGLFGLTTLSNMRRVVSAHEWITQAMADKHNVILVAESCTRVHNILLRNGERVAVFPGAKFCSIEGVTTFDDLYQLLKAERIASKN